MAAGKIAFICHDDQNKDGLFLADKRKRGLEFAVELGLHPELRDTETRSIQVLSCPSVHARHFTEVLIELFELKNYEWCDELWSYGPHSDHNYFRAHELVTQRAEEADLVLVVTGESLAGCLPHTYFTEVMKQRVERYPLKPFEARVILPEQRRSICVNGTNAHAKNLAHAPMF